MSLGGLSVVGYGAMALSVEARPSREQAHAVVEAALEAGIDHVDTAAVYGLPGEAHHNEALLAEVAGDSFVATKGGALRVGDEWLHQAAGLEAECERSLRALRRERIDLYYLHAPPDDVSFEVALETLGRLLRRGLVARVGLSNVSAAQLAFADARVPIAAVQNEASVFVEPEAELLRAAGERFVAYAPMGGWRAGRVAHEAALQRRAAELGWTPHEVALRWLLDRVPRAIAGASRPENVRSSARVMELPPAGDLPYWGSASCS